MVSFEQIQELADRIAREFKPDKIILFGSYAYGNPTADSDVDLLVVMPVEGKPYRKAAEILTHTRPAFGVDLLVRSPENLKWRIEHEDFFLREVTSKGKLLYEAAYAGVD